MVGFPFPLDRKDLWTSQLKPSLCPSSGTTDGNSDGPAQVSQPQVANLWPDIQGINSWKGLLDPINPILKAEILRYGEFAQLCYDAFDDRHYSKYYGTCKHSKRSLFGKTGFGNSGYQITKYVYANTHVLGSFFGERSRDEGVWIGFIAVCTDPKEIKRLGRRDIVIAWRGTSTPQEWIEDFKDILVTATLSHAKSPGRPSSTTVPSSPDPNVRIEKGFMDCYTSMNEESEKCSRSARDIVVGEISRLLKQYEGESLSITLTGHSLGAALATLSAYDIKETVNTSMQSAIPVTVFAFASPRVGNPTFARRMEEIGVKVLRLVNKDDVVPKVPGFFMNENMGWLSRLLDWLPWTYSHVGIRVSLDIESSSFLKQTHSLSDFHSLEVYLHLLDGFVAEKKPFKPSGRDPSLVNKSSDLLVETLHIPPYWWQERNKGLVKGADGKWTCPARSPRSPDADCNPQEQLARKINSPARSSPDQPAFKIKSRSSPGFRY